MERPIDWHVAISHAENSTTAPALPQRPAQTAASMPAPVAATHTLPSSTALKLPSPVRAEALAKALLEHPDLEFVNYITSGFTAGFDIGYRGARLSVSTPNCASAYQHASAISSAIGKEVALGRTIGPFSAPPFSHFVTSALGAAAKSSGGYRVTLDLSRPAGKSVNDGICSEDFSVLYASIDDAVRIIFDIGGAPFMAKSDLSAAFRQCPVRPADYPLLGFEWNGGFYYDAVLPFGLCSAPSIFAQFAEALYWITCRRANSDSIVRYADDFMFIDITESGCATKQQTFRAVADELGAGA